MSYFGEPVGRVKIQTTSKNSQRYYTTKRLIRDLLSNTPSCYVHWGELREYLFMEECVTEVRVSMGLTVRRKTAKNLAVRRKNERILAVSRKKN